ncbi:sensor histidine kinase [Novosphingopyxis sp.]|uniref:sensor histidine kinase n=1 Tax=Novosphingopyxis sp. TaxID=2709690 RepID=UPI003B5B9776
MSRSSPEIGSDAGDLPHAVDSDGDENLAARLRAVTKQLKQRTAERDDLRAALALRQSELDALYDHAPIGLATFDREGRFKRINARLAEINGVPAAEHLGRTVAEITAEMAQTVEASLRRVLETGVPIRHDRVMGFINERSDSARVFDIDWYPVLRDGEVDGVSVIVEDATEAERGELFARHMVRELQHRVKNSLANVMALVEQALRSNRSKDDALQVLKERLTALAQIHGKLTERNWESIGLELLVEQEFGSGDLPGRIDIEGPDIEFGPQSSLAMSMALHEMAANARRYGGLSCPVGHLAVHWRIVGEEPNRQLFLRWRETGCDGTDERGEPGFGSRLIATSVRNALRGELAEHWLDGGLCIEMRLPLSSVGPPDRKFSAGMAGPLSQAS